MLTPFGTELLKIAAAKSWQSASPMEKDEWPHKAEWQDVKRPLLGRLLTGKKTVRKLVAVPVGKD